MDLVHAGHCLMFKECKEKCDYFIVGLHVDPSIERKNKNKPIMSLEERLIILSSNKYVDYIIVYDTEEDLLYLLNELKPQIRFIGEDWKGKKFTGHDLPIKIVYNKREHNYSTTELRQRIKNA